MARQIKAGRGESSDRSPGHDEAWRRRPWQRAVGERRARRRDGSGAAGRARAPARGERRPERARRAAGRAGHRRRRVGRSGRLARQGEGEPESRLPGDRAGRLGSIGGRGGAGCRGRLRRFRCRAGGAVKSADAVARKAHDEWGRPRRQGVEGTQARRRGLEKGERDAAKRLADAAKAAQERRRPRTRRRGGRQRRPGTRRRRRRPGTRFSRSTSPIGSTRSRAWRPASPARRSPPSRQRRRPRLDHAGRPGGGHCGRSGRTPRPGCAPHGRGRSWADARDPAIEARMPAIAVVDSGIEDRADFQGRLVASVNLSRLPGNSPGDGRGHGTFVAGIAAGAGERYTGTAPVGEARLDRRARRQRHGPDERRDQCRAVDPRQQGQYNIRVANFSLHSEISAPFYLDPLDRPSNGSGSTASSSSRPPATTAPTARRAASSTARPTIPFVITVGAADVGSKRRHVGRQRRAVVGVGLHARRVHEAGALGARPVHGRRRLPAGSTLASERPDSVVAPGYMQLSGTSFAAPVVSGAVAVHARPQPELHARPGQGRADGDREPFKKAVGRAGGVGEISVDRAIDVDNPPNPNAGLSRSSSRRRAAPPRVRRSSPGAARPRNASWNSASWNSASWNSASWNSASWNSASWNSASWNSASWNSASWNSPRGTSPPGTHASWNSASWNRVLNSAPARTRSTGTSPS